ncbi:MAG: hypothetical protein MUF76_12975 [Hydrogenophaga sp.]|nr:hypothetical protein [Hydrogenophaga sp.]
MLTARAEDCTGCIAGVALRSSEPVLPLATQAPHPFNLSALPVGTASTTVRMLPVDATRGYATSADLSSSPQVAQPP